MDNAQNILLKIKNKTALVGVMGLGYVGSSVVYGAHEADLTVLGYDIDARKVDHFNNLKLKNLTATQNSKELESCDVICVCVPTPLNRDRSPNLEIIKSAFKSIAEILKKPKLIIVESSVSPGTTRQHLLPILTSTGKQPGKDFYLTYSPERIDPGNPIFTFKSIPKVISGIDKPSLDLINALYSQMVDVVVPVSSIEAAEFTKVLENTFRLINISFMNELLPYSKHLGVNLWEIIDAAATKPFGFLAHYPGPGVGGDCIPVLPAHLAAQAKAAAIDLPMIEAALKTNDTQPHQVTHMTEQIIKKSNGHTNGKKHAVLLVGITYKADVADIRESVALKIWKLLEEKNMRVVYHDPYIAEMNGNTSQEITTELLSGLDAIIVTTPHKNVPYELLLSANKPLIDTHNKLKHIQAENIYRL